MGQTGGIASGRIGFSVLLIDRFIFIEHNVLPAEPKIQDRIPALGVYVLIKSKRDDIFEPPFFSYQHSLPFLSYKTSLLHKQKMDTEAPRQ